MNSTTVRERLLAQQELVRRELTLEEAVDVFEGEMTAEEVQELLEQMNASGYLFFDGDTVMVFH